MTSLKPLGRRSTHQTALYSIVTLHMAIFELCFPFTALQSPLLAAAAIWRYLLIVLVLYQICTIKRVLPTDPILAGKVAPSDCNQEQLLLCVLCNSLVYKTSYHCFRCGKCAHQFDHHCKFLDCCIGGANYVPFLRLLFTFVFYCGDTIFLVVKSQSFQYQALHIGVSLILAGLTTSLLIFHIYLNCWLGKSTLQYLIPGLRKQQKLEEEINSFKDQTRDK